MSVFQNLKDQRVTVSVQCFLVGRQNSSTTCNTLRCQLWNYDNNPFKYLLNS